MTHKELMNLIEGLMGVLFWLMVGCASIIVVGLFAGYAVDKLAQERVERAQYGVRCSK